MNLQHKHYALALLISFCCVAVSNARNPDWMRVFRGMSIVTVDVKGQVGLVHDANNIVRFRVSDGSSIDTLHLTLDSARLMAVRYTHSDNEIVVVWLHQKQDSMTISWYDYDTHTVVASVRKVIGSYMVSTEITNDVSSTGERFAMMFTSVEPGQGYGAFYWTTVWQFDNSAHVFISSRTMHDGTCMYQSRADTLITDSSIQISPSGNKGYYDGQLLDVHHKYLPINATKRKWLVLRYIPTDRYFFGVDVNSNQRENRYLVDLSRDSTVDTLAYPGKTLWSWKNCVSRDGLSVFDCSSDTLCCWLINPSLYSDSVHAEVRAPDSVLVDSAVHAELLTFPFADGEVVIDPGDGRPIIAGQLLFWPTAGEFDVRFGYTSNSITTWYATHHITVVQRKTDNPSVREYLADSMITSICVKGVDSVLVSSARGSIYHLNDSLRLREYCLLNSTASHAAWTPPGSINVISAKRRYDSQSDRWGSSTSIGMTATAIKLELNNCNQDSTTRVSNGVGYSPDYNVPPR